MPVIFHGLTTGLQDENNKHLTSCKECKTIATFMHP